MHLLALPASPVRDLLADRDPSTNLAGSWAGNRPGDYLARGQDCS